MHCPSCEAHMISGKTTLTFDKGPDQTIVIKDIPALICRQCGDSFVDIAISRQVAKLVQKAEDDGLKMGFLAFQPAA